MATSLAEKLPDDSKNVYYTDAFMRLIEDHLPSLRVAQNTYEIPVEPEKAHVYEGDLYGYLTFKAIPAHLHWVVLRMSKMHNPIEFSSTVTSLIAPSPSDIENMCRMMVTTQQG